MKGIGDNSEIGRERYFLSSISRVSEKSRETIDAMKQIIGLFCSMITQSVIIFPF